MVIQDDDPRDDFKDSHDASRDPREAGESRSGSREESEHRRGSRSDRWEDHREGTRRPRGGRHRRHHRKERVLHTRISEQLSDDIRRLAEDLRLPTSNLVRNVLEEVFSVVESVSDDVGEIFEEVVEEAEEARERLRRAAERRRHRGRRRRGWRGESPPSEQDLEAELQRDEAAETPAASPPPSFDEVIGWQSLVMNRSQSCARCSREIARGDRAYVGLVGNGLSKTTLCRGCIRQL
jgi:hypothetical protein